MSVQASASELVQITANHSVELARIHQQESAIKYANHRAHEREQVAEKIRELCDNIFTKIGRFNADYAKAVRHILIPISKSYDPNITANDRYIELGHVFNNYVLKMRPYTLSATCKMLPLLPFCNNARNVDIPIYSIARNYNAVYFYITHKHNMAMDSCGGYAKAVVDDYFDYKMQSYYSILAHFRERGFVVEEGEHYEWNLSERITIKELFIIIPEVDGAKKPAKLSRGWLSTWFPRSWSPLHYQSNSDGDGELVMEATVIPCTPPPIANVVSQSVSQSVPQIV